MEAVNLTLPAQGCHGRLALAGSLWSCLTRIYRWRGSTDGIVAHRSRHGANVVVRDGERKHAVAADGAVCPVIAHMQAELRTEPPVSMLSAAAAGRRRAPRSSRL